MTKLGGSYPSYTGIAMGNNPSITLLCHSFKSNTVVLFFHHNLFWLPALSICSHQTNAHSTGVHNSLSHSTLHQLQTGGTECPCRAAGRKRGFIRKSTYMFLTSKHHQSYASAISILRPLEQKSQREQTSKRKRDLREQFC